MDQSGSAHRGSPKQPARRRASGALGLSQVDADLDQLAAAPSRHRAVRQGVELQVPVILRDSPTRIRMADLDRPRFFAFTSAAAKDLCVGSGAAKAWFNAASSRLTAPASTRPLSRRITSRLNLLTFFEEQSWPEFGGTKSLSAPHMRTIIVVV